MSTEATHKALYRLGWVTAGAYLLIGLVVGLLPYHWKEAGVADQVLWVVLIAGGGLLLITGLRSFEHSAWRGATLVSLGGVAGAVPLFWTLVGPLAAIALIVLSIRAARRTRAAT